MITEFPRCIKHKQVSFTQGCTTPLPFGNDPDSPDSIKPSQMRGQSLPRMFQDNSSKPVAPAQTSSNGQPIYNNTHYVPVRFDKVRKQRSISDLLSSSLDSAVGSTDPPPPKYTYQKKEEERKKPKQQEPYNPYLKNKTDYSTKIDTYPSFSTIQQPEQKKFDHENISFDNSGSSVSIPNTG